MSAIQYIRDTYHVPAKIGGRVRYKGALGTITGTSGPHLIVRSDTRKYKGYRWILHPTWHVEYLPSEQKTRDMRRVEGAQRGDAAS